MDGAPGKLLDRGTNLGQDAEAAFFIEHLLAQVVALKLHLPLMERKYVFAVLPVGQVNVRLCVLHQLQRALFGSEPRIH